MRDALPAVPNSSTTNVGADAVEFYSANAGAVSAKNDGTNTTVSLVVGGGSNVTSVQYQVRYNNTGDFVNIGAPVGRNADGVFAFDWTPSFPAGATLVDFRAVPNTGLANVAISEDQAIPTNATTRTVELSSEGPLGVFQSPYTADAGANFVGVRGTTSEAGDITIAAETGGTYAPPAGTATVTAPAPAAGASTTSFAAILDIEGYQYSAGTEGDQIALSATTAGANPTDDAEGSTLYVQRIAQVNAVADRTNVPAGQDSTVTVTVLDQQGAPVAGASVSYLEPDGADLDTNPDESNVVKYTDANGEAEFVLAGPNNAGTYTFYSNVDVDETQRNAGDVSSSPVTITTYTQQNATLTAESVDGFDAFDFDELQLIENNDDFRAVLRDQNGNPVSGQSIEYRWNVDPYTGADTTGTFASAGTTDGQGRVAIPFPNTATAGGNYTLEVRRPNVAGTGLLVGTPLTVEVAESEITWAEGASANAPVNGSGTFDGTLALPQTGTPLEGRTVLIDDTDGGDASFSSTQPAGSKLNGDQVTAETAADGGFSVSLTDPTIPPNVDPTPETVTLTAEAPVLSGATDLPAADAEDTLEVNFIETPEVSRIEIDSASVFGGTPAPGKPVELDVVVRGTDNNTDPNDDPILQDFPVTFEADKGFFSTDTVDGLGADEDDLVLDSDNDDEGDLYGFYEDLGDSETVSTGDNSAAGIIAAIERDEDFDDDGLSEMTVTVTAGGVSEEVTVEFDARNYLNLTEVSLERAAGSPAGNAVVGDSVNFQLYAVDQFGNLVGDQLARISDDTPDADVVTDGDFGQTLTDFENDNAGITATASAPTVQTILARLTNVDENLVDEDGNNDAGTRTVSESAEPITWVEDAEEPPGPGNDGIIDVQIAGDDTGPAKDILDVLVEEEAAGENVDIFKIRGTKARGNKRLVPVRSKIIPEDGQLTLRFADRNGNRKTRFIAKVTFDGTTFKSNTQKIR